MKTRRMFWPNQMWAIETEICKEFAKQASSFYRFPYFWLMEKARVNFDMEVMSREFPAYLREKARQAGSCIVYAENGFIIQEDPQTGKKNTLQKVVEKVK